MSYQGRQGGRGHAVDQNPGTVAHLLPERQARGRNRTTEQGYDGRPTSGRPDIPGESCGRLAAAGDLREVRSRNQTEGGYLTRRRGDAEEHAEKAMGKMGRPPRVPAGLGSHERAEVKAATQGQIMPDVSIQRRRFIQIAAAGAAAVTQIGCGRRPGAIGQRSEIATTCELCPNKCSVIAVVEDGLIRKLNPNAENPKSRGMLCARGNAGLLQVYDPNRLKQPLIRAGARGEGKWRTVSWDEAFDYTAQKLTAIKEKYGPQGVLWSSTEAFAEVFFNNLGLAFGSPNIVRHPSLCLGSVNLAYSTTFGTVPSFDLLNANYVIMAGANRFESFITPDTMDLIDSTMNRKTRLVYLDPRFTVTAAKADQWYPIKPGSDMAFILAMLHVIVAEGRYDKEF